MPTTEPSTREKLNAWWDNRIAQLRDDLADAELMRLMHTVLDLVRVTRIKERQSEEWPWNK